MSSKQRAVVVGAVVTGILSTSYFALINALCCLGVMIGGAVAAQQLASAQHGHAETGDGALLGAGAGALGAIFAQVFDVILRPLNLDSQSVFQGLQKQMMEQMQQNPGAMPQGYEQMMQQGGETSWLVLIMITLASMIVYAIFGAIGGAIGAGLFGRGGREEPGGQSVTPPEATP